jgi:nitrite reductase/ring-hydroxylating ferredoxin subunit
MLSREDNELITRVGPGTPMGEVFRRFWLPALLDSELPEPTCPPIRARLLGEDLVAFRDSNGQVGFLAENCPHRGASLFFGRNEELYPGLRCAYHGWKFDTAGTCLDMPNEPAETDFKHEVKATAYPAVERGGVVWIYMGPPDLKPEFPQFEWTMVPPEHRWLGKTYIESNYLQALETGTDPSHASFLHRWFDPSVMPNRRNFDAAAYNQDEAPKTEVRETDYGFIWTARRTRSDSKFHWKVFQTLLPCHNMLAPPEWPHLGGSWVPIDDEHCYQIVNAFHARRPLTADELAFYNSGTTNTPLKISGTFRPIANKSNDYLINREFQRTRNFTGISGSGTEDMAMAESMGPVVDRTREHLGTADVPTIVLRRMLIRLARAMLRGQEPVAASQAEAYGVRALCVNDAEANLNALLERYAEEMTAEGLVHARSR